MGLCHVRVVCSVRVLGVAILLLLERQTKYQHPKYQVANPMKMERDHRLIKECFMCFLYNQFVMLHAWEFYLLLQKAKELCIHRTVHAGENGPAADVKEVCSLYGIWEIRSTIKAELCWNVAMTILGATRNLVCKKSLRSSKSSLIIPCIHCNTWCTCSVHLCCYDSGWSCVSGMHGVTGRQHDVTSLYWGNM